MTFVNFEHILFYKYTRGSVESSSNLENLSHMQDISYNNVQIKNAIQQRSNMQIELFEYTKNNMLKFSMNFWTDLKILQFISMEK